MNCMKCGTEVSEGQVFCPECLEEMGKYPVKPGTVVQLPRRKNPSVAKIVYSKWRQSPTAEEQVAKLKKQIRRMFVIWLVTLAILLSLAYPIVKDLFFEQPLLPGQNYTAITTETE